MNCRRVFRAVCPLTVAFLLGLGSCTDPNPFARIGDFDQRPMLENYRDNLIVPGYKDLAEKSDSLRAAISSLSAELNLDKLLIARAQLKATRLAWQRVAMYQFGPAESKALTSTLNIFPIDKSQIERNINSGEYDLSTTSNLDAKGFQTMEFLLYGEDQTETDILDGLDGPRLRYLIAIADDIASASRETFDAWSADGENYGESFSADAALGISPSSSVAQMVNGFIRDFERTSRDGKVGIPLGVRSLGEPILSAIESPFAGYSVELLKENISAFQLMFSGGQGIGFDDYLDEVGAVTNGNEALRDKVNAQLESIQSALAKINDPFDQAILNQKEDVERVFAEMQILIALLKSDFTSSIGVSISYQDTDGD